MHSGPNKQQHHDCPTTYGFIGLGNMGYGMAMNLRRKIPLESNLVICELVQERRQSLIAANKGRSISVAMTPQLLAQQADIVITMLPEAQHVENVYADSATGLLTSSNSESPKLFIDCSTIDVATSNEVASLVEASGLGSFCDAPVSGGPAAADNGTLTFMFGSSSDHAWGKAKPVLALMGTEENIFNCGSAGAGLATKLLNNYCNFVNVLALCEAMNTGIRYGLNPGILASVINASSGMSWNSIHMNPVAGATPHSPYNRANYDFRGGFPVELCKGVNDVAVALHNQVGAKSVLGPVVKGILAKAVEHPRTKGHESRVIYRLFSEDDGKALEDMNVCN